MTGKILTKAVIKIVVTVKWRNKWRLPSLASLNYHSKVPQIFHSTKSSATIVHDGELVFNPTTQRFVPLPVSPLGLGLRKVLFSSLTEADLNKIMESNGKLRNSTGSEAQHTQSMYMINARKPSLSVSLLCWHSTQPFIEFMCNMCNYLNFHSWNCLPFCLETSGDDDASSIKALHS